MGLAFIGTQPFIIFSYVVNYHVENEMPLLPADFHLRININWAGQNRFTQAGVLIHKFDHD